MHNTSSLDTSLIVRLFTEGDPRQYRKVVKLLSHPTQIYVVDDAAVIEMVHVLETVYGKDRADIVSDIKTLCSFNNAYVNQKAFLQVIELYVSHPKLSFVDCYLATRAEQRSAEPLLTFDHKLATQLHSVKEI